MTFRTYGYYYNDNNDKIDVEFSRELDFFILFPAIKILYDDDECIPYVDDTAYYIMYSDKIINKEDIKLLFDIVNNTKHSDEKMKEFKKDTILWLTSLLKFDNCFLGTY